MKNLLAILSIVIVMLFAINDYSQRLNYLDNVASKTPAQVEMKPNYFAPQKNDIKNNYKDNKIESGKFDNTYNEKMKKQGNQTLPQKKHTGPLDIKN